MKAILTNLIIDHRWMDRQAYTLRNSSVFTWTLAENKVIVITSPIGCIKSYTLKELLPT